MSKVLCLHFSRFFPASEQSGRARVGYRGGLRKGGREHLLLWTIAFMSMARAGCFSLLSRGRRPQYYPQHDQSELRSTFSGA